MENVLQKHNIERMVWPSRSPEYNPIKNVWNQLLQRALPSLLNHTNTLDFLKVGLVEEWERLSRECTY
jgi:hypothetical protein